MGTIGKIIKKLKGIHKGDSFTYEGMTFTFNGRYWSLTDVGYSYSHPYRPQH